MKSIRIIKPGWVEIRDEQIPVPRRGQALIKMRRVGICGTDHNIYKGEFEEMVDFPLRPGHEWAGEVAAVGEDAGGFMPGDRVTGESGVSCGKCANCIKGDKYACTHTRAVGTVHAWDGAMSEYFLFPVRELIRIPEGISYEQAALVEPVANAVMTMEDIPVRPGMAVAVMGTGPIGIAAAALARIYGASTIISVGRSEFKLELAKSMGATHAVNTKNEDAAERILDILGGRGADVTIELSGAESLLKAALKATRPHGTVVLTGFFEKPVSLDINKLIFSYLNIRTSGGGWGGYFDRVLELMDKFSLDFTPLITHRCLLEDAPQYIMDLKKDSAHTVKVMICQDP